MIAATVAALMVALAALPARAQSISDLVGVWRGSYSCQSKPVAVTLTVERTADPEFDAAFAFEALPGYPYPSGSFRVKGFYSPSARIVWLVGTQWVHQPKDFIMVDMAGTLSPDGRRMEGTMLNPACSRFELTRESARPRRSGGTQK